MRLSCELGNDCSLKCNKDLGHEKSTLVNNCVYF